MSSQLSSTSCYNLPELNTSGLAQLQRYSAKVSLRLAQYLKHRLHIPDAALRKLIYISLATTKFSHKSLRSSCPPKG